MTTKNPCRYAWLWAFVAAALVVAPALAAEIDNVTLSRFEDYAVVTLYSNAPVTVTDQWIAAKDGKPNRIVVDVTGATHDLPKNNFSRLPKSTITSIRTSQFAVTPNPVVRVVLDLAHATEYEVKTSGRRVRIMVSAPDDPPIEGQWSARDLSTTSVFAQTDMTDMPAGRPAETTVKAQAAIQPSPKAPAKPSADAVPESSPAHKSTPMADASTKPAAMPLPLPSGQAPASESEPAAQASAQAQRESEPLMPTPMPQSESNQEINYNLPVPADLQLAQGTTEETEMPADEMGASSEETTESPSAMPLPSPATPETDASAPTAAADQPEEAESEGSESVMLPVPDSGSEAVASLSTLPPLPESTPDVVPPRSNVTYQTMGRRDPFAALVQVGAGFNAAALPDVNSLRLVGVLHDVQSSWGLFEDANGYGYILKKGDRVQNGRLSKLTENKAFFQLSEFGWSRSVELDLEREG